MSKVFYLLLVAGLLWACSANNQPEPVQEAAPVPVIHPDNPVKDSPVIKPVQSAPQPDQNTIQAQISTLEQEIKNLQMEREVKQQQWNTDYKNIGRKGITEEYLEALDKQITDIDELIKKKQAELLVLQSMAE